MSILVTDMEMPTGCVSCDFVRFFSDGDMYCGRLKHVVRTGTARLDGCPLQPAPEPEYKPEFPDWEQIHCRSGLLEEE